MSDEQTNYMVTITNTKRWEIKVLADSREQAEEIAGNMIDEVLPDPVFEEHAAHASCIKPKMHPYTDEDIKNAPGELEGKTEMDALIAHLQGLGTTIKARR